jgi:tetratricopeptide (TPR) repeat protein
MAKRTEMLEPMAGSHESTRGAPEFGRDMPWLHSSALMLTLLAIVATVVVTYWPTVRAGFIWNDSDYVTAPHLRTWAGLPRIWLEVGATEQYYPILHTAFWIEHRLWGDSAAAYHFLSVIFHATSACLLVIVLQDLRIRGAVLAGFVFALHPICVESVAWVAEQKNTLSLMFYLGSALAYLRFERTRLPRLHATASLLFLLALFTKSVTATLPAALLVIIWWRRGKLDWKRDVRPLVSWFFAAVAFGLFSAWVEHTFIGAQGSDFNLSVLQRVLLAGRVIVFYATKLFWPQGLVFIYPRWRLDTNEAIQWIFPTLAFGSFAVLWRSRNRNRGALAAYLFFVGSLLPTLGFFNVYAFRFSFVADHWQYLPSLGLIVAATNGVVMLGSALRCEWLLRAAAGAVVVALAVVSSNLCREYQGPELFYRSILAKNPEAWLAHNNLGLHLLEANRLEEAIAHFREALRLRPRHDEVEANLGGALLKTGRYAEAAPYLESAMRSEVLQRRASYPELQVNWAAVLLQSGRINDAISSLRSAVRAKPEMPEAHIMLGWALGSSGDVARAVLSFEKALRINPDAAAAHFGAGFWLTQAGHREEAIEHYRRGLTIARDNVDAHRDLCNLLLQSGRAGEALPYLQHWAVLRPDSAMAHFVLANGYLVLRMYDESIDEYHRALQLDAKNADAHVNLAVAFAGVRRWDDAITECESALRLNPYHRQARDNLSSFQAARGKPTTK